MACNLINVGNSIALTLGLVSKLIQCIRFLDVKYSSNLQEALHTWGTDMFNLNLPQQIDNQIVSQDVSILFTGNGVEAAFLSNFWDTMVIQMSILTAWIICYTLGYCVRRYYKSCQRCVYITLEKLSRAVLNFLVVSVYSSFGDVVFFSILGMMSLSLSSPWSNVSFALSLMFVGVAVCLIGIYFWFLIRYQQLKSCTQSAQAFQQLIKKYEALAVLHEDMSDANLFKKGFMLILICRDISISVIVTTMTSSPLAQSTLLVTWSIIMCTYLVASNPFRNRFEQFSQLFIEICVLIVYVCVLIYTVFDYKNRSAVEDRERLGQAILVLNSVVSYATMLFMIVSMVGLFWTNYKNYRMRGKTHVQTIGPLSNQAENDRSVIDDSYSRVNQSAAMNLLHISSIMIAPVSELQNAKALQRKNAKNNRLGLKYYPKKVTGRYATVTDIDVAGTCGLSNEVEEESEASTKKDPYVIHQTDYKTTKMY